MSEITEILNKCVREPKSPVSGWLCDGLGILAAKVETLEKRCSTYDDYIAAKFAPPEAMQQIDKRLADLIHGTRLNQSSPTRPTPGRREAVEAKQWQPQICPGCKNEIDPETCHCGEDMKRHGYESGHNPVPVGCTCGYAVDPLPISSQASKDEADLEMGRAWRENSSLGKWFPFTAEELERLKQQLTLWRYAHDEIEAACGGETALMVREKVMSRRARIDKENGLASEQATASGGQVPTGNVLAGSIPAEAAPEDRYTVEVDDSGCEKCGAGKMWMVVDTSGVAGGTSYDNFENAESLCEELNTAFDAGRAAAQQRPAQWREAAEKLVGWRENADAIIREEPSNWREATRLRLCAGELSALLSPPSEGNVSVTDTAFPPLPKEKP